MAEKQGKYEIVYMLPGGSTVIRWRDNSPPPHSLYFYRPVKSVFFTRYYPMFKVWRIYDLRQFKVIVSNGKPHRVVVPKPSITFTDRDAAIMWMGLNV